MAERLALLMMARVARDYLEGERSPWNSDQLAHWLGVPVQVVERIAEDMQKAGLLLETGGEPPGLVPGRSPERIPMRELLGAVRAAGGRAWSAVARPAEIGASLARAAGQLLGAGHARLQLARVGRQVEDHPVDPGFGRGVGVVGDQREATRSRRRIAPAKRRGHVLPVAGVLLRDRALFVPGRLGLPVYAVEKRLLRMEISHTDKPAQVGAGPQRHQGLGLPPQKSRYLLVLRVSHRPVVEYDIEFPVFHRPYVVVFEVHRYGPE